MTPAPRLDKWGLWRDVGFSPHESQLPVAESAARFRIIAAGRRWGKSRLSAHELIPEIMSPGTRSGVVAPTYELTERLTRYLEPAIRRYKMDRYTYRLKGRITQIQTPWGSEFRAMSSEEPDKSLPGDEFDALVMTEAALQKREIWHRYLRPMLADRKGWAILESSPRVGWFKEVFDLGQDPSRRNYASWQRPTWSRPGFDPLEVEDARTTMPDGLFRCEFGAEFVLAVGSVWSEFSRNVHVSPVTIPYNPNLRLVCSIDFGYRMPSVGWYQIDDSTWPPHLYLLRELSHIEKITSPQLGRAILAMGLHPYTQAYVGDPAGDATESSGLTAIRQLAEMGIRVRYTLDPALRDIVAGVAACRGLFRSADGQHHVTVSGPDCPGHIEDWEGYRYPRIITELGGRLDERPFKDGRFDHGADDFRYLVANELPSLIYGVGPPVKRARATDERRREDRPISAGLLDARL